MNSMEESTLLDKLFALRKTDKLDKVTKQMQNLNPSSQAIVKMIVA